mmetsp:Transcript_29831/g.77003  ORF Transcript_29831/g.77003 Transcript_29831/m.77003 type:complete len:269 (+) Transcript_29831:911-1717(+)
MALPSSRHLTRGKPGLFFPCIFRSTGATNRLDVTLQLTGFPGKPKKMQFLPFRPFPSKIATVVGFPGFMHSLPNRIFELCRSSRGFIKSCEPIETPPLVITTSAVLTISRIRLSSTSWLSRRTFPSRTTAPSCSTIAFSIGRLESTTCPGSALSPKLTSSSPVEKRATTGLLVTNTVEMLKAERSPSVTEVISSFSSSNTVPLSMSHPIGRMSSPGFTARRNLTISPTSGIGPRLVWTTVLPCEGKRWVSSTCTTASAPSGTGEPVVI